MKKYYPKSIMFYISLIFIIIVFIILLFSLYVLINNAENFKNIRYLTAFVALIIGIIYYIYKLLHLIIRSIDIYDDRVYVREDIGSKDIKLQYDTNILFNDIDEITMMISSNNSKNQYMRFVITPMPYIIFHLKNGKKARINVYYYSKKQIINILDYIIGKVQVNNPEFQNITGIELIRELKNVQNNH